MDASYNDLSITNIMTEDEGTFTEEERELIGREAAKLKKEFEAERNKRRGAVNSSRNHGYQTATNRSAAQTSIYGDPLAEETEKSLFSLRDLDKQLQDSMHKKQQSLKELSSVQDELRKNRNELKRAEKHLHETSRKFDHEQGELSTLEYKKETLRKDLRELDDKLSNGKRLYSNTLEMNTSEILSIIEERDALKRKLNESTLGYIERLEFERQITQSKDELFAEQRSSRMRIEALQAELDQALQKSEDAEIANAELHMKLGCTEKETKDKQAASSELASLLRHEVKDLKQQIEDLKSHERKLHSEIHNREKNIQELQHLLVEKEKEISYEHDQRAKLSAEKNYEISSLKDSHEKAVLAAIETAGIEKTAALAENNEKHAEERHDLMRKQEERIVDIEADHLRQLDARDQEILYFKEKLRQQEEATRELGERLRLEAQEQVRAAVSREKTLWEDEHARIMKRERVNWEEELDRTQSRLNEAIEYEKGQVCAAQKIINSLKREIDEIRHENKELHKEATSAMLTAQEAVKQEHHDQMSSLRHQLTEERDMEVSRLQRQLTEEQEEILLLKSNFDAATNQIHAMETSFDHHERTIVLEINDECKKVAQIIGIHARKVNIDKYEKKSRGFSPGKQIQRTPTTDSLANLRACISELLPYVNGLREAIDSVKLKMRHLKDERDQEFNTLKNHYEMEKEKEVENMKQNLVSLHMQELREMQDALNKESDAESNLRNSLKERENEIREMRHNMGRWKEDTASKLAKEIEKDLETSLEKRFREDYMSSKEEFLNQQKLIIRMEDQISRLKAEQAMGRPGSSDSSTVKLLRHLQDRVRQLKIENARLKTTGDDSISY